MSMLNHLKMHKNLVLKTLTAALLAVATVFSVFAIMLSLNTVSLVVNGEKITFKTSKTNEAEVLALAGYEEGDYVINNASMAGKVISLDITPAFPVYVTTGNTVIPVTFTKGTVNDVLKLAGITLDEHDIVSLSPEAEVTETKYIDVVNVDYQTETVADKSNNTIVTFKKKLVNGNVVQTEVLSTKTAYVTERVPASNAVKEQSVTTSANVGAMSTLMPSAPIELDKNGNPVNYKKHLTTTATAYTYTGNNCSTGVAPQVGYIAVNPNFIPYGTKMFIKSSDGRYIYGYAVAADTGGFIRDYPYNVDLFLESEAECVKFGRRSIEIFILE